MAMRKAILNMSGRGAVALILVSVVTMIAGFVVMKAGKPTRRPHAGKISTTPAATVTYGPLRSAKPDRLELRVLKVFPNNGVISAYEPVIVELLLTNISSSLASVYSSSGVDARIEVRDSHGNLVGDSPVYSYMDRLSSGYDLSPRQSMRSAFVPSAVYQFKNPGIYHVRIMLLGGPAKDLGPAWAEVTIPVTVQPFDEKRLKTLCGGLFSPRNLRPSSLRDYPPREHMMALWSIRHNAALPTLRFVAENWDAAYARRTVVAIRRIGTPESAALLRALMLRKDRTGRAARSAAEADVRIHGGDYFSGWIKIRSPEATVNEFLYVFRTGQWEQARSMFNYFSMRGYADELKSKSLFANRIGKSVESILNDPGSRALRSRKEGKFTIVDVGHEGSGQSGIVQFQLAGGGDWSLTDFPRPAPR